jgi:hypothetical protein
MSMESCVLTVAFAPGAASPVDPANTFWAKKAANKNGAALLVEIMDRLKESVGSPFISGREGPTSMNPS